MRFLSPLKIRALSAEEVKKAGSAVALYEIIDDFDVELSTGVVKVQRGFITDFASIPWFALWFINDDSPGILYPSVIHDYLYTTQPCDRETADRVMATGMIICGARMIQVAVVYWLLRLFGGSHWSK